MVAWHEAARPSVARTGDGLAEDKLPCLQHLFDGVRDLELNCGVLSPGDRRGIAVGAGARRWF
jgi:hypothetical protein